MTEDRQEDNIGCTNEADWEVHAEIAELEWAICDTCLQNSYHLVGDRYTPLSPMAKLKDLLEIRDKHMTIMLGNRG